MLLQGDYGQRRRQLAAVCLGFGLALVTKYVASCGK